MNINLIILISVGLLTGGGKWALEAVAAHDYGYLAIGLVQIVIGGAGRGKRPVLFQDHRGREAGSAVTGKYNMTLNDFIAQKQAQLEQFQNLCEQKFQQPASEITLPEDRLDELFDRYDFGLLA